MGRTLAERISDDNKLLEVFGDNLNNNLRVAMPGIIQSFDSTTQTVTVQLAIKENIRNSDLSISNVNLPLLLDVPIIIPKAGGFVLTMPIQNGDECLIIFGDMCIDSWWNSGGIQGQAEKRRHDLSDGFAILGVWSQPNIIPSYSTNSAQLRSLDGNSIVDIKESQITITSPTVNINGHIF